MVKINLITRAYLSKCYSRASKEAVAAKREMLNCKEKFAHSWEVGARLSRQGNAGFPRSLYNRLYSTATKTDLTKEDLPPLLGILGTFVTPVPGGSVIGFALGKVIKHADKLFKKP